MAKVTLAVQEGLACFEMKITAALHSKSINLKYMYLFEIFDANHLSHKLVASEYILD